MIAKLTGILDSTGEDWAIVDVHGVGYLAACSARLLARIGRPGDAVTLYTETRIRDEVPHLYGFGSRAEQEWFRLLTLVQGVGGRVALAILSVLEPEALALAIASGDKASLARADGVGPKLAARIAAELKDKATAISLNVVVSRQAETAPSARSVLASEAVSALVNLGYGRADAFAAVTAVSVGESQTLDALIRAALRQLSAMAREIAP